MKSNTSSRVGRRLNTKAPMRKACQQIPTSKMIRMAHNQVLGRPKNRKPVEVPHIELINPTEVAETFERMPEQYEVPSIPEGKVQCPRCSKILTKKKDGSPRMHKCS